MKVIACYVFLIGAFGVCNVASMESDVTDGLRQVEVAPSEFLDGLFKSEGQKKIDSEAVFMRALLTRKEELEKELNEMEALYVDLRTGEPHIVKPNCVDEEKIERLSHEYKVICQNLKGIMEK